MKRKITISLILIIVFALSLSMFFVGCKKNNPKESSSINEEKKPTEISLNVTELELNKGETAVIFASVSDHSVVSYSSDNQTVATVSSNGTVTAVKAGVCSITATANGVSAKCRITVIDVLYAANIKGISEQISIVCGKEFKTNIFSELNGERIDDKIDYSVVLTDKAQSGVAIATIANNSLTVKAVSAGITSFSIYAVIKGVLTEKTFSVVVYANEVVIEPENNSDFDRMEGFYSLTLATVDGTLGLKNKISLDFEVQVNGDKQNNAKVEFDTKADYNLKFDSSKAEVVGDINSGYYLQAKSRGETILIGRYDNNGEDVFVTINLQIRLPEKEITNIVYFGRENEEFTAPNGVEGNLEEVVLDGVTISTATNGLKAVVNKELMPNGGNEKVLAKAVLYTDKYCYKANAEVCTKLILKAQDIDSLKMVKGDYKAITGYYMMVADVDFSEYGKCTGVWDEEVPYNAGEGFKGVLDGNGFKMKNVTVGTGGLLGHVGSGAVFKDIVFDNVYYKNENRCALIANTLRGAELTNITVNVVKYEVLENLTSSTGSWVIKYDVGLLASRFFMECKVNNVTINADGHEIVNIFGHKCVDNEFAGMKIVAKSYKIIGCNSDTANVDTEIKTLPKGVLFTAN